MKSKFEEPYYLHIEDDWDGSIDIAEEEVFLELEKIISHNHPKFVELKNKYPQQYAKFARTVLDLSYWG